MPASKNCEAYGLIPGYFVEGVDAIQAYTQAPWDGVPTWVELAYEWWPESWKQRFTKEDRPVALLLFNLYGHPQAGPRFERWADVQFRSIGYMPIENWRSCYFHPQKESFLIAYVDDIMLSGPLRWKHKAWAEIRNVIDVEQPAAIDRYLGCYHHWGIIQNGPAEGARSCEWQMIEYLNGAVQRYKEVSGVTSFKKVLSPHIDERSLNDLDFEIKGELEDNACSVIMGIFYGARLGRWDLMQPTTDLSRYVTKWCRAHDKKLLRLVSYIAATVNKTMSGYVGDCAKDLKLRLYVDSDHGGDLFDRKATSGVLLVLEGPRTWFPLASMSKRQTSTSNGSTEAETVALSTALRLDGLPTKALWELLLGRKMELAVMEDNDCAILAVQKGYSPTLRYLTITQGVSISLLHDIVCVHELADLLQIDTEEQAADIFTKAVKVCSYENGVRMLNIKDRSEVVDSVIECLRRS